MTTCKLTFKKAFGIDFLSIYHSFWLMQLKFLAAAFTVKHNKKIFEISVGYFGVDNQQKFAISLFRHSDERDLETIHQIPTIDITFETQIEIPEGILERWHQNSIADNLVRPFIADAFKAVSIFIDAYRDLQYTTHRGSDSWRNHEILFIPQFTEAEFQTYLFYILKAGGANFVGCFSGGQTVISTPFKGESLQRTLGDELPFERKLIVKAWEYFFQDDYRSTIIYSAIVIEFALKQIIQKALSSKKVANSSRIGKFVEDTSNRLLSTVMFGLLEIGNEQLREELTKVFEIRNELLHHRRRYVHRVEAEKSLKCSEELLKIQGVL